MTKGVTKGVTASISRVPPCMVICTRSNLQALRVRIEKKTSSKPGPVASANCSRQPTAEGLIAPGYWFSLLVMY